MGARPYTDEEKDIAVHIAEVSGSVSAHMVLRMAAKVDALRARLDAAEQDYKDALGMHLSTANHAAVVCGDHWNGLAGEPVDGSEGCPWCRAASLEAERGELERRLDAAEGVVEQHGALLTIFGMNDARPEQDILVARITRRQYEHWRDTLARYDQEAGE